LLLKRKRRALWSIGVSNQQMENIRGEIRRGAGRCCLHGSSFQLDADWNHGSIEVLKVVASLPKSVVRFAADRVTEGRAFKRVGERGTRHEMGDGREWIGQYKKVPGQEEE
jgi:hypothetical protein